MKTITCDRCKKEVPLTFEEPKTLYDALDEAKSFFVVKDVDGSDKCADLCIDCRNAAHKAVELGDKYGFLARRIVMNSAMKDFMEGGDGTGWVKKTAQAVEQIAELASRQKAQDMQKPGCGENPESR